LSVIIHISMMSFWFSKHVYAVLSGCIVSLL